MQRSSGGSGRAFRSTDFCFADKKERTDRLMAWYSEYTSTPASRAPAKTKPAGTLSSAISNPDVDDADDASWSDSLPSATKPSARPSVSFSHPPPETAAADAKAWHEQAPVSRSRGHGLTPEGLKSY
eukprot:jgi/Mesvir1/11533/Mv24005-RA.1